MTGTGLAVIVGLLIANAFFVGAEFALISARRTQLEPCAEAGSRTARITLWAMGHVSLMMATAQLGITACTVGLGAIGEPTVAHLLEGPFHDLGVPDQLLHLISFAIALVVVTALHVVFAEMVPKNFTLAAPDRAALLLGPPLVQLTRLLRPIIAALNAVANVTLRLMRVQPRDDVASTFSPDEVSEMVTESHQEGLMDPDEHQLVSETFEFTKRRARDIAIAPARVEAIWPDVSPAHIEELAAQTGHSRFPVRSTTGTFDGYVHVIDVLEDTDTRRHRAIEHRHIRRLPAVGIDEPLTQVLHAMREAAAHLAQAVDRRGRPRGIITLDDILTNLIPDRRPGQPDTHESGQG